MSALEPTKSNDAQSRRDLLDRLQESKLLAAEELERAEAIAPGAGGKTFGAALVEAGLLTSYQVEMVLGGRQEKLKIGNYDLLEKLGTGGTGTVFKAMHRKMKRVVALKVLARNLCKDKSFVQRFQREIETLAQFSHPNIVMAYDADEAKVGHYLVMEFVAGHDLASVVQKRGVMGVAEAVGCILQAARGLAYVHSRKMIHRDMKPANLLRDAEGVVKVTDLGLARTGRGSLVSNSLTQAGGVLGTVDYMPPEQALDSTNLDHRSDIYSLGATLYYLLIGGPPYPGQTMIETILKHREAPIPSLMAARPDVPPALDELFQRMLAKTIEDRVQTMSEVVCSLEIILSTLEDAPAMSLLLPGFVEDAKPGAQPHRHDDGAAGAEQSHAEGRRRRRLEGAAGGAVAHAGAHHNQVFAGAGQFAGGRGGERRGGDSGRAQRSAQRHHQRHAPGRHDRRGAGPACSRREPGDGAGVRADLQRKRERGRRLVDASAARRWCCKSRSRGRS